MYFIVVKTLYENRYLAPRYRVPSSTVLRDEEEARDDPQRGIDNAVEVAAQLKVALYRLGTKGISVKKVSFTMGVSDGSVHVYTWWCIYAIEDLLDEFVVWPDRERKSAIADHFKTRFGFPFAIGAVDGVPFPFDRAPALQPPVWITRKMTYAMGATAVPLLSSIPFMVKLEL
ncbi:hypothetical protein BGX24_003169 [Mortierella sp. AD032]|nr:hypothetical protein BGX24_003169 [Mortierella sp. AD032]